MANVNYTVGSGYRLLAGKLREDNKLVITGNGAGKEFSIASTSIFGFGIPTTLYATYNGNNQLFNRAFDATLINKGVSFVGVSGNDRFDATKYKGNVDFNGNGGTNTLKGSQGHNVFTHELANSGVDTIVGGKTNELIIQGTAAADALSFSGNANTFSVVNNNATVIAASSFAAGKIVANGKSGNDHVDLRAFTGVITFNGEEGDDTLIYKDGTSGKGTVYNGGADRDGLGVDADAVNGSNLTLTTDSLKNGNADELVKLSSVEEFNFVGAGQDDSVDATGFAPVDGRVIFRGREGNNEFKASTGNNDVLRELANSGHDTIIGNTGGGQTTLEIVGNGDDNAIKFIGVTANTFTVTHNDVEVVDATDVNGRKVFNGDAGNDTADVTEYAGIIEFNGGAGNDTLTFKHNTSGAGTTFNGNDGDDTLVVVAQSAGSTLSVNNSALLAGSTALVTLASVEKIVFNGSDSIDNFDASAFTGKSSLNGGNGADTLKASTGGSEITGGKGADIIVLSNVSSVDTVIYADGDSTFAARDKITNFSLSNDKLYFDAEEVQGNNGTFLNAASFQNGVVTFSNNIQGFFAQAAFNALTLEAATTTIAAFADDQSVVGFVHKGQSYIVEYGNGLAVDNIVELVGTSVAGANLNSFISLPV